MSDDIINMLHVGGLQKPASDRIIEHIEALRAENEKLRNSLQDMTVRYSESIGEREKLRAALKPFAELWSIRLIAFDTKAPDDYTFRQSISCGIVRAAAAALKETGDE